METFLEMLSGATVIGLLIGVALALPACVVCDYYASHQMEQTCAEHCTVSWSYKNGVCACD